MKKINWINLISLLIISYTVCFLSCAHPTNKENVNDPINNYKVYLTGRVLNKNGDAVPYAIAHLKMYNVLDTTDNNGIYEVTVDLDNFTKTKKAVTDTSDTLQILKDGQIITTFEIINFIDTLPDVMIVQRDIGGTIASIVTQFSKIEAVIWNHSDTILKRAELEYSLPTFSYGGFFYFVYTGTTQNYSIYVNIYSTDSLFIGRSDTISFTSMAGDIQIPVIDPKNAIPSPIASADSAVSINDSLYLKGTASDRFGGIIVKWEWDAGNTGAFVEATPDSSIIAIAPSTANSAYPCVLKVTDNDGNIALDTVAVNVLTDAPIPTASTTTPTVSINDTIRLQGTAIDLFGFVVKWEWKFGNNAWVITSTGDTSITAPSTSQSYVCSLRVTDDDGVTGVDEVLIYVNVVADIDGNVYHYRQIGNQIWTIDNLRTTKYKDGSPIPYITNNSEWSNDYMGAYCFYNNDEGNKVKYGLLYNNHAVNTGNLAPNGWHVPTDNDWNTLKNYLIATGFNWDSTTTDNKIGKSLATKTDWDSSFTEGNVGNDPSSNNSSGFSALPGGRRRYTGSYVDLGYGAYFASRNHLYARVLRYREQYLAETGDALNNGCGHSVRLVKD